MVKSFPAPRQAINCMKAFTHIHASFPDDIYEREARCLDYQLSCTMLPPKPEDLFVGRNFELPICFVPQSTVGTVGYCCDEKKLLDLLNHPELSENERKDILELLTYWKGKTTKEKIKARYSGELLSVLSHGDYSMESGTAFPLYRMSGAQMDPSRLLSLGIDGLMDEIRKSAGKNPPFYQAALLVLGSFQSLCLKYADTVLTCSEAASSAEEKQQQKELSEVLSHIAHKKPDTFYQAAQLSYLYFLVSGTYNYGRMDVYLGDYYARDLNNGILTEEKALALLRSLWTLIIDRHTVFDGRIILGGKDRKNPQNADRFALDALEASLQTRDVLPQLTLRCYEGMNPEVYDKALFVIGAGTTFPILYNDDRNIPAVRKAFDVTEDEAASYVPFGCGEYVLYNKSFGTPSGIINYLNELNRMICGEKENYLESCPTFTEFYQTYLGRLKKIITLLAYQEKLEYDVCAMDAPFLFYSILFDDCLASGKPIFDGGIRYLGGTLEGYGNINASDSLTAIKKLVYEEKKISPGELAKALRNNFSGCEAIRRLLLAAPKYGNDDHAADDIAVQFHNDTCQIIRECKTLCGLDSYLQVIINNDTNTVLGMNTGASADGRAAYTFMANANNPTGGMDRNGITAMMNSLVKLSPDVHAGAVQNLRFSREWFGPLLPKTKGLLAGYFLNGGTQAMITVLNRGDLEQAMLSPEKYQNLIVRVGGFSARFVELSRHDQEELLSRTLY